MESPTYFLIACNKIDDPLYFQLLFGTLSNTNEDWIEFKGSGNIGPGIDPAGSFQ